MGGSTMGISKIIRFMAKGCSPGQMEGDMKAISVTNSMKALGHFIIPMGTSIKGSWKEADNMG